MPGSGLQKREGQEEGEAKSRPCPPNGEGGDQLESGRDGGNMMKDKEEFMWDVMREDQRPTQWGYCQFIHNNIMS